MALAPFSWMTCCVLEERQDLLTVQGLPVRELEPMIFVLATLMMLVWDVCNVSLPCTMLAKIVCKYNDGDITMMHLKLLRNNYPRDILFQLQNILEYFHIHTLHAFCVPFICLHNAYLVLSCHSHATLLLYSARQHCWEPGNDRECTKLSNLLVYYTLACTDGSIRLVGGTRPHEGRVEVCLNRRWGTVCDDAWGTVDASVACRQLGFSGHSKWLQFRIFFEIKIVSFKLWAWKWGSSGSCVATSIIIVD